MLPTNSSELVVQKKKVAEMKNWLEQAFSSAQQVCPFLTECHNPCVIYN